MEDYSNESKIIKLTVLCSIIIGAFGALLAIICILYNGSMDDLRYSNQKLREQNEDIRMSIYALSVSVERITTKAENVVRVANAIGRPLGVKFGIGGKK